MKRGEPGNAPFIGFGISRTPFPPGCTCCAGVRERILNGFSIDVFALLWPETEPGRTGTKRDKKGTTKGNVEHTVHNWHSGFMVYMGLVGAAYPERAWHLINHLGNVLKARSLAGDGPVIEYNEIFRQRASHNELARWDLRNNDVCLETVGQYARAKGKQDRRKLGFCRDTARLLCWKFNEARYHHTKCKFDHLCEAYLDHHARMNCNKAMGTQPPFRGTCPSSGGLFKKERGNGTAKLSATKAKWA